MSRDTSGAGHRALTAAEVEVLRLIDPDEIVAATQRLIGARGENPPGQEQATADELAALARERGLDVTVSSVSAGRPNVRITLPAADRGGTGPGLLILGHTDVVPVGDPAEWTTDPFGAEIRDGRIFGRGSTDMKGGLAAALVAMDALRRSGVDLSGPVYLDAVCDEEQNGIGIRDRVDTDLTGPTLLGCVVAEPTDLATVIAARGASYLTVEVRGTAAHAGRPEDGTNAITGAALIVADLDRWHRELAAEPHPLVGPATFNVGVIHGGTGGSIVPDLCRIEIDRRLLPGERVDTVLTEVRARVAALGLEDRGLTWEIDSPMAMPGFITDADDPLVRAADRSAVDAGRAPMDLQGWTAACDGGFIDERWGVPVIVQGPGSVATQAHRTDESVGIDEVVLAARGYALTALRLLGA